jgi:hypothetical protein
MVSDRLLHLQNEVNQYYKQLAGKEKAKHVARLEDKELIQQQIELHRAEMQGVERDYWLRWQSEAAGLTIPEAEAEVLVGELLTEVDSLAVAPKVMANAELVQLLQEMKAELTKPGLPGAGKFKAAIPLLPGFLAYELELDTEGLLRRIFPLFSKFGSQFGKPPKK